MTVKRPEPRRVGVIAVDAPPCALGESPRWAHDAWWWVDAEAGVLWTADSALGSVRRVLSVDGRLSLMHPTVGDGVVVASGTELLLVDPSSGQTALWATIALPSGWLLNDGTADEAGRLWIGSVHPERRRGAGALYVVDLDGSVRRVAGDLTLSNGMAWAAPDLLLHVDSFERCLWEHEVDPIKGTVRNSRRTLRLRDGFDDARTAVLPDGLAIDVEGGLWVAMYGGGEVLRLVDGRVHTVLQVPTAQVTSVAFGGADGRDLLVTTAQEGMDLAALAADRNAGRLFRARAEVSGAILPAVGLTIPGPTPEILSS